MRLIQVGGVIAVLSSVLAERPAMADEKLACVAASDAAQTDRSEGRLHAARAELLVCTRDACPPVVRQFCEKWLEEVRLVTPSVVIRVSDAQRRDVSDVRVLVDGRVVTSSLDGRPLEVDPGVHRFRFEPAGVPAFEHKLVVVEGEKDRVLAETIPPSSAAVTPGVVAEHAARPVPASVYALGAVDLAALGAFAYFTTSGESDYSDCSTHGCGASTRDAIDVKRVLAWSSLGVGVAALGVGTWLFVARPVHGAATVGFAPVLGGGIARVGGEF